LAAGVAHQVNNPISYVTSNLQTLAQYLQSIPEEESGRREEINDLVADTRTGLQRIGEVVRNLLDFSRAEAGRRLELIDLRECIESTLRIAQQEYRYVAKIERDYEELPMVEGYAGELNQVILAIITNAAQAISAAGLRDAVIRIQTRRSGSSVICRISNSGPPIPQDERARIFEPFYTTKQRGSGTGLGLSIAGDIVMNRHHGSLSLEEAEEREQTTFRIVLPLRQPDGR
jgi:signal transduction histidine kinase